jgi:putative FmdB family regulatory protein
MYRVFDFKCGNCGHVHEVFTNTDARTDTCPKCGEVSGRQVSAPRFKLEGISGHFPTAADKFERMHVEGAKRKSDTDN